MKRKTKQLMTAAELRKKVKRKIKKLLPRKRPMTLEEYKAEIERRAHIQFQEPLNEKLYKLIMKNSDLKTRRQVCEKILLEILESDMIPLKKKKVRK